MYNSGISQILRVAYTSYVASYVNYAVLADVAIVTSDCMLMAARPN